MESDSELSENDSSFSDHRNRLSLDQTTMALLARLDEITLDDADSTVTDLSDTLSSSGDKLHFHSKTGSLVHLSNEARTAERIRPLDEFNNAVVMTHRPLQDDELFEIRIDKMVEKWSGSIEVGITTHDPNIIAFPGTMTNLRSGTIMMSGCGILTNGKGTRREYGHFNLDDLQVGDRIGLTRKKNLDLHYFVNGIDQGVAASSVVQCVWGVVDLYGRTVKVTIVDHDDHESANLMLRRRMLNQSSESNIERTCFHPRCGKYAAVINNGRTVHRPNAKEDFNNGVVLTNRPLRRGELFEVRLDKLVSKWAGSIEIGVTIHKPTELNFPTTMTNVTSGTWMMTGNGVMHNGTTVMDNYGQNLDRLQIGDRVGVLIDDNKNLHFFVNGEDQGESIKKMPDNLYGVVDLYGQAAEATIVESDFVYKPFESSVPAHLKFHSKHGRNIMLVENGTSAKRMMPHIEFNDAIVLSMCPLKTNDMFCIIIDKIMTQWKGSLKIGVTTKLPQLWELPCGLSDVDKEIWLLSGSSVFEDGVRLSNNYCLNLDTVCEGSVIGITRFSDGSLHYFLNNIDMGCAFNFVPNNLYVALDLYGRCCQVSIGNPDTLFENIVVTDDIDLPPYTFHMKTGQNIKLEYNNTVCARTKDMNHGLVFSSKPLENCVPFEFCIERLEFVHKTLRFGLTTLNPSDGPIPESLFSIDQPTWFLDAKTIYEIKYVKRLNFIYDLKAPDSEWKAVPVARMKHNHLFQFRAGTHVALKLFQEEDKACLYVNGKQVGCFMNHLPSEPLYAVVDVHGSCTKIYIPNPNDDALICLETPEFDKESNHSERNKEGTFWWSERQDIYDEGYRNLKSTSTTQS
ncbi:hypothetical protein WDU94_008070 [Cyamophila willieti]